MNRNGYVNFILTVLTLAVVVLGYLGIQAVDRLRESNGRVIARLDALGDRLAAAPAAATTATPAAAPDESAANYAFFDRNAVPGGRLIQAIQADTPNLNYLVSTEATAAAFNSLCNSSLAERNFSDPEEFQPMLAESWEVSPDHKTYRIKLRRGVYWHDFTDPVTGREHRNVEVTAADFKFMVDVIRNPEVNCGAMRVYYQDLDEIEILNDYEFIVRWKEVYYGSLAATLGMAPLPRQLYWDYEGPFNGAAFNDDHERNRIIVGCGPYRFVRWDKDRRVIFRRNERYFGNALGIGPALDDLVYEIIKLPNTRYQALLAGKLDQLDLTPDQWVTRTTEPQFQDGTIQKHQYLTPSYTYIGWNGNRPIFADARVRRALTLLIDRERIRRDIYFGLAETVTGPFFPLSRYADPAIKPWPYDPAAAARLLAEAGWRDEDGDGILEKDGQKFVFTMLQIATSTIQQKMMPMIKESLAAAGIDMRLQNVEWSVYIERLNQRNYDACCLGWTSGFDPDLYQIWHSSQRAGNGSNHIGYSNPEVDRLIETMRRTFNLEERVSLAHRIGAILHEEQPYTFLFAPYNLSALSGRYRNVRVFPVGIPEVLFWVPRAEQRQVPGL